MPPEGSNHLPDIVAQIRLDSSGIDAAIGNLIGSFSQAAVAIAVVAAAVALLVYGGKSMLDIFERHQRATNDLEQAVAAYNRQLGKTTKAHTDYIAGSSHARMSAQSLQVAHERVALASNAVRLAQEKLTYATYMYGPANLKTHEASIRLADAQIRLAAAERLVGSGTSYTAAQYVKIAGTQARAAIDLSRYQQTIEKFIKTNRAFISDQSEVITGYAKLTRAGVLQSEVQKDMNRAVDLAALKHVSLSDAVDLLNAAEHGRLRGLIDLGISTTKYTDAQGNLVKGSKNVKLAMAELDQRLKGGRQTLSELQKHVNILSSDWQDLSEKGGPVLLTLLDVVVTAAAALYDLFNELTKEKFWSRLTGPLEDLGSWLNTDNQKAASFVASKIGPKGVPRAAGGPVIPGGVYTIGEQGPETLVMALGGSGGTVVPHGRSGTIKVNVYGTVVSKDPARLAQTLRDSIR